MSENNGTRRFSLDEDFMNYKTDDLLYGFMRSLTTTKPVDDKNRPEVKHEEYLLVKNFQKYKKVVQGVCGVGPRAINDKIKKLIEAGLVELGEIDGKPCYYFPYDYYGVYKIIGGDMLQYLVSTRNAHAIRIYLFLLNCRSQKEDYVFTIREIKQALGYAVRTQTCDVFITNVLESFQKEGVIKYAKIWETVINDFGKETPTERYLLKFIATNRNQF